MTISIEEIEHKNLPLPYTKKMHHWDFPTLRVCSVCLRVFHSEWKYSIQVGFLYASEQQPIPFVQHSVKHIPLNILFPTLIKGICVLDNIFSSWVLVVGRTVYCNVTMWSYSIPKLWVVRDCVVLMNGIYSDCFLWNLYYSFNQISVWNW